MRALLLASACALLTSCASSYEVPAALAGPIDSTVRAAGLSTGKIKFQGPVTFQVGGTNNTASTTAVGKAKGPTATAPHAVATDASTKASGPAWWVFALVGVAAIAAWEWLSKTLPLGWLFWRKN